MTHVTVKTCNAIILGGIYAIIAMIVIFRFNGRLIPDTSLYANGQAAWSSFFTALAGQIGGLLGVQILAIVAASSLGCYLGYGGINLRIGMGMALLPSGWSMFYAGADSLGSLGSACALRLNPWFILVVGGMHLEAGLVSLVVFLAHRFTTISLASVAIGACIIAMLAQWHFQARYLLPGLCIAVFSWNKSRCYPSEFPPN